MFIIWYVFTPFVKVARTLGSVLLLFFYVGTCTSIHKEALTTVDECVLDLGEAWQKVAKVSCSG